MESLHTKTDDYLECEQFAADGGPCERLAHAVLEGRVQHAQLGVLFHVPHHLPPRRLAQVGVRRVQPTGV